MVTITTIISIYKLKTVDWTLNALPTVFMFAPEQILHVI